MPGLNGSRHMIVSGINTSWNKRCCSITCGYVSIDKKRRKETKNNPNKDNAKKKQSSDIDTKSQESVIDALTIHLDKILMTSDTMNNSINHHGYYELLLLLQVLRNAHDNIKFNFSLVDNN
jgi:hypothetical protein